jgi:hypothetical protein
MPTRCPYSKSTPTRSKSIFFSFVIPLFIDSRQCLLKYQLLRAKRSECFHPLATQYYPFFNLDPCFHPRLPPRVLEQGLPVLPFLFPHPTITASSCSLRSAEVAAVKRGRLGGPIPFVFVRQCEKSPRLARALKPIQQERNEDAEQKRGFSVLHFELLCSFSEVLFVGASIVFFGFAGSLIGALPVTVTVICLVASKHAEQ